jgi:putative transferase (TIGR04331 family)
LKRRLLVTTALEPSWGDNEEIVFLGEWCKKYSRKHLWQEKKYNTLDYHWRDRAKLKKDHTYLENLHEATLLSLSAYLNKFHGKDDDVDHWRIIVGPWLITYIPVLWDRWELISSLSQYEGELSTIIINQDVPREIPNDYRHATDLMDSHLWNHQIFASMLDHRTDLDIKIETIEADVTENVKTIIPLRSKLRSAFRRIFNTSYQLIECLLPKKNSIVFFHSYFPRKSLLQLYFRLGLVPRSHSRLEQTVTYPFGSDRKNIGKIEIFSSTETSKNTFESFVSGNILQDIPICHLEGYKTLHKIQAPLCHAQNIFTANAHFGNELFKVWAVEQKKLGSKLIISSHGGSFNSLYSVFDHQEKIADFRVVWGRKWFKNQVRLPANKLHLKMRSYYRQGYISLIDNDYPNYSYRCASIPMGPLSLETYKQVRGLINLLSPQIRNKLKVRPKSSGKWEKELRYIDEFGPEIISSESSIEEIIVKSRLVICTYPMTTFAQSMFSGVPSIIVYCEEFFEVQPIYNTLISNLKDAGIMHTTEISAANHIAQIFDDPMEWWNTKKVKLARSQFNDICLTIDDDPIKLWTRFFKQLPNGDIKSGGEI